MVRKLLKNKNAFNCSVRTFAIYSLTFKAICPVRSTPIFHKDSTILYYQCTFKKITVARLLLKNVSDSIRSTRSENNNINCVEKNTGSKCFQREIFFSIFSFYLLSSTHKQVYFQFLSIWLKTKNNRL